MTKLRAKGRKLLRLINVNARSLYHKLDELENLMHKLDVDIACITETWFKPEIPSEATKISGYKHIRKDRENRVGGGVCIYVRDCYPISAIRATHTDCACENLWTKICINTAKHIIVGTVYRTEANHTFTEHLGYDLDSVAKGKLPIFVAGDFNYDYPLSRPESSITAIAELEEMQLTQLIHSKTRITEKSETLLDHIWTNAADLVEDSWTANGISDHLVSAIDIRFKKQKVSRMVIQRRNYQELDQKALSAHLKTTLDDLNFDDNVYNLAYNLEDVLKSALEKFLPIKTFFLSRNRAAWFSHELKEEIRKRDEYENLAISSGKKEDWENFRRIRNQVNRFKVKAKSEFHNSKILEAEGNNRSIWKTIRQLLPEKNKCAQTATNLNKVEDKVKSEEFNNHFTNIAEAIHKTISITENSSLPAHFQENTFALQQTNVETVTKILKDFDQRKATGIDGLSVKFLQLIMEDISSVLTRIINKSISSGIIPCRWKQAIIKPIHKKGSKEDPNNFRPISILPVMSKVLEKVVSSQLSTYLEENNLLSKYQFGFRKDHSTIACLLNIVEDIRDNIEKGKQTGLVSIDLSKAFDTVDHGILLTKLKLMGLQPAAMKWFENYLQGRKQRVKYNDEVSSDKEVKHGVPQGSVLGPLLFVIYINDLPNVLKNSKIAMYADDTTIYCSGSDGEEISKKLEGDLARIDNFFSQNKLKLNKEKCHLTVFGKKKQVCDSDVSITIGGSALVPEETVELLGVTLDNTLNWKGHIDKVYDKCSKEMNFIQKATKGLHWETKITIFNSLIMSKINYGDVLYDSCNTTNKTKIQKLQNRGIRYIFNVPYRSHITPYRSAINWMNMDGKRRSHLMVELFKIIKGDAPSVLIERLEDIRNNSNHMTRQVTRADFYITRKATNVGLQSFFYDAIKEWNSLPADLRALSSTTTFRHNIKKYFLSIDKYK